jgi:MFS family permease
LNDRQIGFMFAYIGVCSAVIQGGLIGKFNDRFGERKLLVMGTIFLAVGLTLMPFFNGDLFMPWELFALLIIALSNGFLSPSLASMLSQNAEEGSSGEILGLNQSFGSLARVAGPILGGTLYDLNFHLPYLFGAFILMGSLYLAWQIFHHKV